MAAQAGRLGVVKVSATDASYNEISGVKSIKAGAGWISADQMETTKMGDTAPRSVSSGFFGNASLDVEMISDPADTNGQVVLTGNDIVWVQYAPAPGTSFKKCQMSRTISRSGSAGADVETLSVSFKPAGGTAPAAV